MAWAIAAKLTERTSSSMRSLPRFMTKAMAYKMLPAQNLASPAGQEFSSVYTIRTF